ncbi:hypothetical protein DH2020_011830 [Rehmannia glutinosa]|uniref:S-adenosylmethionine decarboxylase proenzyme n=1 Tax=Rehmannia glutinosa TaxID=99300 RepID=A0ABR0XEJ3_REHGL
MALQVSPIGLKVMRRGLRFRFGAHNIFSILASQNVEVDSYVLSESSLFVYHYKIILKTCGTTKLLLSIPPILKLADTLKLTVSSVKYTRGSFIFPGAQPFPHRIFSEEVDVLDSHFTKHGLTSKAYVMDGGDDEHKKWHVYSASAESTNNKAPVYTLEMCMTNLDQKKASVFFKSQSSSAAIMTEVSGISKILLKSEICDFDFDPCGYSMNAIEGSAVSTIHVTPKDGFSYASFEAPAKFYVALHSSVVEKKLDSKFGMDIIGYACGGISCEALGNGGSILYSSFISMRGCGSPRSTLQCCWSENEDEEEENQTGNRGQRFLEPIDGSVRSNREGTVFIGSVPVPTLEEPWNRLFHDSKAEMEPPVPWFRFWNCLGTVCSRFRFRFNIIGRQADSGTAIRSKRG